MGATPASAGSFAAQVLSYDAGATPVPGFVQPFAALGLPGARTGAAGGFQTVMSPFNPHFEESQIVSIGEGGHLALRLQHFAVAGDGLEIGVVSNAGLIDEAFPSGQATDPVGVFGDDSAHVEVSADGVDWVALAGGAPIRFELPAIYDLAGGPFDFDLSASSVLSDFGLPFDPAGGLSAFAGRSYSEIVDLFAGSGGGTWLDLSATGLSEVGYVRFSVLDDGDAETELNFELDALLVATAALGDVTPIAVPEPALLALFGLAAIGVRSRRAHGGESQRGDTQ